MADNQTEKQKVQEFTDKDVELTMMDAQKQIDPQDQNKVKKNSREM